MRPKQPLQGLAQIPRRHRQIVAASLLHAAFLLTSRLPCYSQEHDLSQEYQFVLAGIEARCSELRSGSFRAHGTVELLDERGNKASGPIQLYCAFDFERGRVRFDRSEPEIVAGDSPLPNQASLTRQTGGQFIRTRDAVISLPQYYDVALIQSPATRTPSWAKVLDIRCLGLSGRIDVEKSFPFERVFGNYGKNVPAAIGDEGEGIAVIEWITKFPPIRRQVWVDKNKAYTISRHTLSKPLSIGDSAGWAEPFEVQTIEADLRSGQWVPTRWTISSEWRTEDVRFEWISLNEPIDSSVFEPHGFDLADASSITDDRLGAPITIEQLREPSPHDSVPITQPVGLRTSFGISFRTALIAASILVVTIISTVIFLRRTNRH